MRGSYERLLQGVALILMAVLDEMEASGMEAMLRDDRTQVSMPDLSNIDLSSNAVEQHIPKPTRTIPENMRGKDLKRIRHELNISTSQLAAKMKVSRALVNYYESERRKNIPLPRKNVGKIIKALRSLSKHTDLTI